MVTESVRVNVSFDVEQLLDIVRQLDEPARVRVAQALMETNLDAQLKQLISSLAGREPADDITDEMINEEIKAVRQEQAERRYASRN